MINNDRIVPVQAIDLISLYAVILLQNGSNSSLAKLDAEEIAKFEVTTNSAVLIASEPVKSLDFDATASSVSAGTVYFVPAYDYEGISIDGTIVTPADGSAEVDPDGKTLYKAVLATGEVTITKIGF